jgi:hypothetical protein
VRNRLGLLSAAVATLASSGGLLACSPASGDSGLGPGAGGGSGGSGASHGAAGPGGSAAGGSGQGGSGFLEPGTGSGPGSGSGGDCTEISEGSEALPQPVDIIVAVDTSGSMNLEAQWTQAAMPNLAQTIVNSGIDTRVVMISSCGISVPAPLGSGNPCPDDSRPPYYLHVNESVGSRNALSKILDTYAQWQPLLRADSKKQFLVVTDDNSDMSAQEFMDRVHTLDPAQFWPGNWVFHGIFAFANPWDFGSPCVLVSAAAGTVYFDLTRATLGLGGDLCSQNFDPIFQELATTVVQSAELSCEWDIPPPEEGTINPLLVNVTFTGTAGEKPLGYVEDRSLCDTVVDAWYYDDNISPTRIFACPSTCTELKGAGALRIDIAFGCDRRTAVPR